MKKSTIFLFIGAVVLAVVAFFATRKADKPAAKPFEIAGFASDAELEADKKLGLTDARPPLKYPIDEVLIERQGESVKLVRSGEGDDAKWRLAAPVDAPAVKYPIEAIIEVFKSKTVRSDARAVKAADFRLFDFEPERRIGLTLKSKGSVWNGVDLVIGQVVKGEGAEGEPAVKGTWVMVKGDESTAFLLADKDLRTPLEKPLGDLRDKRVFDFEADQVSRVEVVGPDGAKVVVTGTTVETPPAPDAKPGEDGKPPKATKTTTWALAEPAGVKADDNAVGGVGRNVSNLRVTEFVPADKASEEAKAALAGKVWKVSIKAADKDYVLTLSDAAKDPIWGRVEGRDELFSLASYAANNLRKSIDELKDKTVWDLDEAQVTELTLKGDNGPITLAKVGADWKFVTPAVAYAADAAGFLAQGKKLTAVRWAKPSEVEAARKALATPDITASVKVGDAVKTLTIAAVEKDADGGGQNRWAIVGDVASAEPFLLADFNAKRFQTTVDALRHKKLLGKDEIEAVTIQLAGQTEAAALEKPSTGGDLTIAAPPAGKVPNDEAIRTIVSTLGALEAKTFHEGKGVDVTGLDPAKAARITVRGAGGATTTLLVSATSAGEGTVYAMVDSGPLANVPVAINEYQAKNLTKSLADLTKDAELPKAPEPAPAP